MNTALRTLRFSTIVLLFVLFFYLQVSSFQCDSGSLETTCTLTQPQTLPSAQSISGPGNLVIESTADLNTNASDLGIAMGGFIENRGDVDATPTSWWGTSGNWLYRKTLTFNNTAQTSNLTDFPVLITLTTSDFNYSRAQSNGADIRFTDSDGSTLLNYEIEDWNSDSNSYIWVKVPQINASSSTDFIYMYYGNATAADGNNDAAVWDSSYEMVQHLDGTTHSDSTSNNNDGTFKGSSLSFDGSGDQVALASQISYDDGVDFSLELWYKGMDTAQNGAWGKSLMGRDNGDIYANLVLRSGYVEYVHYDSAWLHNVKSSTLVADGAWHHVVFVNHGSTKTGDLWIDGTKEINGESTVIDNESYPFRIDYFMRGYNGQYTSGIIDEARVYSRALSASEVAEHYRGTYSNNANLVGLWHFDEATGTTAGDDSGNNNDGTITNATWSTETRVIDATGKIDGADAFNGVDDYVGVGDNASMSALTALTVEVWMKSTDTTNDYGALVSKYSASNREWYLGAWPGQTNKFFELYIYDESASAYIGRRKANADLYDGDWHHLVGTWDGGTTTASVKLYKDGTQIDDTSDSSGTFVAVEDLGANVDIGRLSSAGWYVNGTLDSVRISSTARSADWIAASYLNGAGRFSSVSAEQTPSTESTATVRFKAGSAKPFTDIGLVADWNFNEGSGTTVNDSAGSSDGTVYGTASWADSNVSLPKQGGSALAFNGTDTYVSLPSINFDFSDGFSVCTWAYYNSFNSWSRIIDFGQGEDNDNIIFANRLATSTLTLSTRINDTAETYLDASAALETGRWMFLCGTVDGSNNGKIYKDANLAASGTVNKPQNVNRTSSFIGKSNWSADSNFDGYLDEVRVYNRALSIEEIQQLYNSYKPETAVLHLKFDGGTGITATDSSAHGNNGELRNFHAPRSTGWTPEAVDGNALEFDGVDDYVTVGNIGLYTQVKTLEMWVKPNSISDDMRFVSNTDNTNFSIRFQSGGVQVWGTSWQTVISTAGSAGEWVHYTFIFDGSGNVTGYKNGEVGSTVSVSESWGNIGIGANLKFTYGTNFNGLIDEVRVYDRALSRDEIIADMREGALGKKVLHLKFDEESSSIRDYSSFNNFGDLNGNTRLLMHFDENAGYLAQDESGQGNTGTIYGNTELLMNFDDNTSSTIKDLSGNGNNGTLYGSTRLLLHMDEGTGQTVSDSTAYANNGTYKGSSLSFNGSTDYVSIPAAAVSSLSQGTISAWVKYNAFGAIEGRNDIFSLTYASSYADRFEFFVNDNGGVQVYLRITDGSFPISAYTANNTISLGQWHHISISQDGSQLRIYVDGSERAIAGGANSGDWFDDIANENSCLFGRSDFPTLDSYINATIDEARIYSRVLSATEIQNLYRGTEPSSSGLVGLYHFDEGTGTAVGDDSGNNNNGTLSGADWSTDSPAIWQSSGVDENNTGGSALAFNGVDEYVDVGDPADGSLDFGTSDFSLSAWIKLDTSKVDEIAVFILKSNEIGGVSQPGYILAKHAAGNNIWFQITNNGADVRAISTSAITDNNWHYIVATRTGSTGKIYIDGVDDTASSGDMSADVSSSYSFRIGYDGNPDRRFNGSIDEVAIHARALTAAEIQDRYNSKRAKFSDWNAGKSEQGLQFDGSNDYIEVGDSANLRVESSLFTVALWMKPDTVRQQVILFKSLPSFAGSGWGLIMNRFGNDITLTKMGVADQQVSYTFTAGTWYHVGAVQGTNSVEYFINGVSIGTFSNSTAYQSSSGQSLKIGGGNTFTSQFDGTIDEVSVYSKALSTDEISELYAYGKAKHSDWVAGKNGTALEFDGVDDYIQIDMDELKGSGAVSIEGWYYLNDNFVDMAAPFNLMTDTASPDGDGFWWHIHETNNWAYLRVEDSGGEHAVDFSQSFSKNQWYHVVFVVSTDNLKMYLDNSLVYNWDITFNWSSINADTLYFWVGSGYAASYPYASTLDEVAVYSKALSADEVSKHYAAGKARHSDFNTGISGKAIQFDGVDDYVDTTLNPQTELGQEITVEAWIYPESESNYKGVGGAHVGTFQGIVFMQYESPAWRCGFGTGSAWTSSTGVSLNLNNWNHVVCVFSGGNYVKYYVDGVLKEDAEQTGSISHYSSFWIGRAFDGTDRYFDGSIDDARVYNYAKSAQEIEADYNAGAQERGAHIQANDSGLVSLWHLDGNAEQTTALDANASTNNGTLTNFTFSDLSSGWVEGKYGRALSFDGSNDYIDCGTSSTLTFGANTDFTVEAWINRNADAATGTKRILERGATDAWTTAGRRGYQLRMSNGAIHSNIARGDDSISITSATDGVYDYRDGQWHYVVATFDRDGYMTLYVDADVKDSDDISSVGDIDETENSYKKFIIGKNVTSDVYNFPGLIDEVAVYNRALTATEIKDHYYAFVNKGEIYSPGAIKAFEGS